MYPDAILNVQKMITIYKALNNQKVADFNIAMYLQWLGTVQGAVKKYDDALRNFREAEKIFKELAPYKPQAMEEEESIKKAIEEMVAKQKKEEKGALKKVV
jgi:tetratricopeptide (TPR) repeat protein